MPEQTTTTPDLDRIKVDLQDFAAAAAVGAYEDDPGAASAALLPLVDAYAAAKLRDVATFVISDDTKDDVLDLIRKRADELSGDA